MEPELPTHSREPGQEPSLPVSPDALDEDEQDVPPTRAATRDLPGKLKRIGLIALIGILVVATSITAWAWTTRGTWELASLWPFGAATSSEPQESPAPAPAESPDPERTEGAQPANSEQVLDDTRFSVPVGWSEYQNDQPSPEPGRLITKLLHAETGVLLQVTSVTPQSGLSDLASACEQVSASQQEQFTDITVGQPVSVGIDQAQGAGFTCGFHGTRSRDGVPNTITFTFLLRASDSHVLILRSIIPDSVSAGAAARQELAGMNCAASLNFGVTGPLC